MADLHARTRLALMRRCGLLRDANAVIQHLNPACRAARSVPHLPLARLLLSLVDSDVSSRIATVVVRDHGDYVHEHEKRWTLRWCIEGILLLVYSRGSFLGDILCYLFATTVTSAVAIGLYYFFLYQRLGAALFVAAIVFVCVIYDLWLRFGDWVMKPIRRAAHRVSGGVKREQQAAVYEEFYLEEKQDQDLDQKKIPEPVDNENSQIWYGGGAFGNGTGFFGGLGLGGGPSVTSARAPEVGPGSGLGQAIGNTADMDFAALAELQAARRPTGGLDWTNSGADFLEAVSRPRPRLKPTPAIAPSPSSNASWGVANKSKPQTAGLSPKFDPGSSTFSASPTEEDLDLAENSLVKSTRDITKERDTAPDITAISVGLRGLSTMDAEEVEVKSPAASRAKEAPTKLWRGPAGKMKMSGRARRERSTGTGPGPGPGPGAAAIAPTGDSTHHRIPSITPTSLGVGSEVASGPPPEQQSPGKAAAAAAAAAVAALPNTTETLPPLFDILAMADEGTDVRSLRSRRGRDGGIDEQPHPMQRSRPGDSLDAGNKAGTAREGKGTGSAGGVASRRRKQMQSDKLRGRSGASTRMSDSSRGHMAEEAVSGANVAPSVEVAAVEEGNESASPSPSPSHLPLRRQRSQSAGTPKLEADGREGGQLSPSRPVIRPGSELDIDTDPEP